MSKAVSPAPGICAGDQFAVLAHSPELALFQEIVVMALSSWRHAGQP
jgi:hypothetical protein